MAKKEQSSESDILAQLIAEKKAAGLSLADAETCAKAQIEHDKALAESAKE